MTRRRRSKCFARHQSKPLSKTSEERLRFWTTWRTNCIRLKPISSSLPLTFSKARI